MKNNVTQVIKEPDNQRRWKHQNVVLSCFIFFLKKITRPLQTYLFIFHIF